jgi:hypothetical protein
LKDVLAEAQNRVNFLQELRASGVRDNVELSKQITNYYAKLDHLGVNKK